MEPILLQAFQQKMKMFLETKHTIETLEISHLHVFPYSEKEGTPASRMPQVPTQIRRERARKLREIGKKIYYKLLKNQTLQAQSINRK